MLSKSPNELTRADLDALINDGVPESRQLDYKHELPGRDDASKKEFLADVCSFANAGGGYLLYGVSEKRDDRNTPLGVPEELVGCDVNVDESILRLEQVARTGIAPRVSTEVAAVADTSPPVIVLEVHRSWNTPHMVTFKNSSRFYSRTSAGKYQLDIGEIRRAFTASDDLSRRLSEFRAERVSQIARGNTAVPLKSGARLALHVLPLSAMELGSGIDLGIVANNTMNLRPMEVNEPTVRYNLDGFLLFRANDGSGSGSYVQVFRSGAVEAVLCNLIDHDDGPTLASSYYELVQLRFLRRLAKAVRSLALSGPFVVMLSLIGVRGAKMALKRRDYFGEHHAFDRNVLLIPEVVVEQLEENPATLMRPIFDTVWQSAGFESSLNYDNHGLWNPDRAPNFKWS